MTLDSFSLLTAQTQVEAEKEALLERMQHLQKISCLPKRFMTCSFDNYEMMHAKQQHNVLICQNYLDLFVERKANGCNLIFTGRPGTGKTHLGAAIANALIHKQYYVIYSSLFNILRSIKETYRQSAFKTEQQVLQFYLKPDLLIIDEAGMQFGTDTEKLIIFELFNARYEQKQPSIVISNLTKQELNQSLGVRVMDRLQEGQSVFLSFDWASFRSKK